MEWKLPDGIDRMAVNAAMTTLTERWDMQAACLVVLAFSDLPQVTSRQIRTIASLERSNPRTRGLTPEYGMVDVEQTGRQEVSTEGGLPESMIARVGSFKITNVYDGTGIIAAIAFGPFQYDLLAILGERPLQPTFIIEYHIQSCVPLGLFRIDFVAYRPSLWERWERALRNRILHPGKRCRTNFQTGIRTTLHVVTNEEIDALVTK